MSHKSEEYCRSCTKTVQLFQGKWKVPILCAMRDGPVRLGQLARVLNAASKKVLTENLRVLEQAGMIVRQEYDEALRHVEYDFREELREELKSMLDNLACFGNARTEPHRSPSSVQQNGTPADVREEFPKRERRLA